MTIETPRLILREMTGDDYAALYEVLGDSDIMRHYPYAFDEKRVRGWISRNIERYADFGFGLWAVTLRETGEMIGDCGVTMQSIDGAIRPEIGCHIAKRFQRRGYATEAARACRDFVFESTPFRRVYSYMKAANAASRGVAVKNGMSHIGDFTDGEGERSSVYCITREQWALHCKG